MDRDRKAIEELITIVDLPTTWSPSWPYPTPHFSWEINRRRAFASKKRKRSICIIFI